MAKNKIVVKGVGQATATPDLIVVEFNLEAVEQLYDATMVRSTEQLEEIRASLMSAGHDKSALKTTHFAVETKYDSFHDNDGHWHQQFAGYRAAHSLHLEFDLDMEKLSLTLAAIGSCEAKPHLSIMFSVKDKNAVREELLTRGVEDALWKARILADAAGVTLGDIISIDYNWSEHHIYSATRLAVEAKPMRGAAAPEAAMDISPEDIKVNDSVKVTWVLASL
ncbi:MAG: SIMPL domain-containing protein [Propionibacteriaceae bacterium]|jgi:uncharacterized protein YggE|nr:SIMPL domain-containing protein [Propionibacteriaceae bacterium]